jgi:hypothetical protein
MSKFVMTIASLLMCGTILANAQVSSGQGQGSGAERSSNAGKRGTTYSKHRQIMKIFRVRLGRGLRRSVRHETARGIWSSVEEPECDPGRWSPPVAPSPCSD